MRSLLDECCPHDLAAALRERGHDVVHVTDAARGATDLELAAWADAEGRLMVTEDFDFGELAVRHATPRTGVVIVFCPGLLPQAATARAVEVIEEIKDGLAGFLSVVEGERVRRRML